MSQIIVFCIPLLNVKGGKQSLRLTLDVQISNLFLRFCTPTQRIFSKFLLLDMYSFKGYNVFARKERPTKHPTVSDGGSTRGLCWSKIVF
jgi:hypothetical protein